MNTLRDLGHLGWPSLESRNEMSRFTLLYKMCYGLVDIDVNSYLCPHNYSGAVTSYVQAITSSSNKRWLPKMFLFIIFFLEILDLGIASLKT